jgi:2-polyprenyl-3-methyl-5-hydroxy-6-metoxy-1,4-benzoquinol methylase
MLLDRSSERKDEVERRLARTSLSAAFLVADIDRDEVNLNLPLFDTVVMAALLEHLEFPEVALKNFQRLMKSGARLVLTTPTPLGGNLHWLGSHLGWCTRRPRRSMLSSTILRRSSFFWRATDFGLSGMKDFFLG